MKKQIKITINKTSSGYVVSNFEESKIDYFNDDDEGRQQLIKFLANDLLNAEVEGGRLYK